MNFVVQLGLYRVYRFTSQVVDDSLDLGRNVIEQPANRQIVPVFHRRRFNQVQLL